MPANIRNFWITGKADGNNPVAFGPKSAGGGVSLRIQQRDAGRVTEALTVYGNILGDGTISLTVYDAHGGLIYEHGTVR